MMGREVKRVPVDWDWPVSKTWEGYLMPDRLHEAPCPTCGPASDRHGAGGDGYTPEARAISDTFYPHMIGGLRADALAWHNKIGQAEVDNLIEQGRLRTYVKREPTEDNPRDWEWAAIPRIAAEVNAKNGRIGLDSHDAINRMILVRFRCERLGITVECPTCQGCGTIEAYEGQRAEADAWERSEPPEGEGWQLWETVSEGSPISPVFLTAEALAQWLTTPAACWGAMRQPMTIEAARKFVGVGWAPSLMSSPAEGVRDGAEWIGTH